MSLLGMSLLAMPAHSNRKLRQCAKDVCRNLGKSQTEAEKRLWEELRDRKFHGLKFYRQYPLFVDWLGTETVFVADFFCFERQLVIEVDGRVHDHRADHDRLRTFIINQLGIQVVRFGNQEIESELAGVLARLHNVVSAIDGR